MTYTFSSLTLPAATSGRGGPLSYQIMASIISGKEFNDKIIITQDEIDQIRQEYIDVTILVNNNHVRADTVPARGEFRNQQTYVNLPGHFPFDDINGGDYTWVIFTIAQNLENIRTAIGNRPMDVRSGYRNPAHNAGLIPNPGAPNSRHIYGDAADIANGDFNGDGDTTNDDRILMRTEAKDKGACVEPLNLTPWHIHMDWRGPCPHGW